MLLSLTPPLSHLRLVVLKQAAERAFRGRHGGVEHVDVVLPLLCPGGLWGAEADLQVAALVVGAVGARHELTAM